MGDTRWVFGYGSLIWRQDFPYLDDRRAHVIGWARRFWQGSHDHRGDAADPGRVVTLIAAPGERCDGRAFLVGPEVFAHLDHREKNGYVRERVTLHFDNGTAPGVAYLASADNAAYLGPAPAAEMIRQIRRCRGDSGTNVDYVIELARALRRLGIEDPHVFELESMLSSSS